MLIHNKDGIQFITEFPCLLKHTEDALLEHTLATNTLRAHYLERKFRTPNEEELLKTHIKNTHRGGRIVRGAN